MNQRTGRMPSIIKTGSTCTEKYSQGYATRSMKINVLLIIGIIFLQTSCVNGMGLVPEIAREQEDGSYKVKGEIYQAVEKIEEVSVLFGIPAANYISELFLVASGIGLSLLERSRRKQKKATGTLVKAIEKQVSEDIESGHIKVRVAKQSKKDGTAETIDKAINENT